MDDTATLTIVNPVAEPLAHEEDAERFPPAPRPETLDGQTHCALLERQAERPRRAGPREGEPVASGSRRRSVRGDHRRARRHQPVPLTRAARPLERDVDVAVCTSADCGSCYSWLMRDLCELERRGIPADRLHRGDLRRRRPLQPQDLRRARGLPADRARVLLEQDRRADRRDGRRHDGRARSRCSPTEPAIVGELPQFSQMSLESPRSWCSAGGTSSTPSTRCSATSWRTAGATGCRWCRRPTTRSRR